MVRGYLVHSLGLQMDPEVQKWWNSTSASGILRINILNGCRRRHMHRARCRSQGIQCTKGCQVGYMKCTGVRNGARGGVHTITMDSLMGRELITPGVSLLTAWDIAAVLAAPYMDGCQVTVEVRPSTERFLDGASRPRAPVEVVRMDMMA